MGVDTGSVTGAASGTESAEELDVEEPSTEAGAALRKVEAGETWRRRDQANTWLGTYAALGTYASVGNICGRGYEDGLGHGDSLRGIGCGVMLCSWRHDRRILFGWPILGSYFPSGNFLHPFCLGLGWFFPWRVFTLWFRQSNRSRSYLNHPVQFELGGNLIRIVFPLYNFIFGNKYKGTNLELLSQIESSKGSIFVDISNWRVFWPLLQIFGWSDIQL